MRAVLAHRHNKVSPQCSLCNNGVEDIKHMIFLCKRVKHVWHNLGLEDFIKEALVVDRLGSVVLEELLRRQHVQRPNLSQLSFAKTIVVGA